MSKHTPGPPLLNKRRPYEDSKPQGYTESDRDYIENNKELCLWFLDNYHLSAAAPELLEALKETLTYHPGVTHGRCGFCGHYGDDCRANRIKALINKAEGREG